MKFNAFFLLCLAVASLVHGVEAEQTYVIKKNDKEIREVCQGYFQGSVFIQHGVSWKFSENITARVVARSEYRRGKKVGASQYLSSGSLVNPLKFIVDALSVRNIETQEFATHYWKLLAGKKESDANTKNEKTDDPEK